ncbi:hypothetical protein DFH09DRAFT_1370669 [Mycena vulgaris]|nr:hypothetical protein DFH09DRAFT_1370669 [Mycena vulgaris]
MPSACSKCGAPLRKAASEDPANIDLITQTLPRHQGLLATNAPPDHTETAFIKKTVSKNAARLADVMGEISRLRIRLEQLEDERASLSRSHAQHKVILSPLRRIPPEDLAEIFSWTLPSVRHVRSRRALNVADSPWVLTHTSGCWRAVALSTPSLWSLVAVEFDEASFYSLPMLRTQLSRAQALRIHFYGYKEIDSRLQIETFQCLADHSARWEELTIELTSDLAPLLDNLKDHLSSLRKAWIQSESAGSQDRVQSIGCFQTVDALFDVHILNQYRHIAIPLPAQQLTQYTLDASWTLHRDILKLTRNLVDASIDVRFDDHEAWPEDGDIIDLLSLQRMYISHPKIMQYLKAPALLAISIRVAQGEEPIHHLDAFLVRSSCNLQILAFQGWTDTPNSLQF